jgi:hypothetical protein
MESTAPFVDLGELENAKWWRGQQGPGLGLLGEVTHGRQRGPVVRGPVRRAKSYAGSGHPCTKVGEHDHLTIFSCGSKSHWNRNDLLAICATAAFSGGSETAHTTPSLGVTTTAFDADSDIGWLVSAICPAKDILNRNPAHKVTILSPNPATIQAITDLQPHAGQFFTHEFCNTLTQILPLFRIQTNQTPTRVVSLKACSPQAETMLRACSG